MRTREIIIEMQKDAKIKFSNLKVDGGASNNDLLMQIQADLLQVNVIRPQTTETTALGAAFFAGLATGYWAYIESLAEIWEIDRKFTPENSPQNEEIISNWEKRIGSVLNNS
jgi:glycerol kinase